MFLRNNWLFIPVRTLNSLKTEFKELRVRDKHTSNLYWFTLTPRATSSPQKPLVIHYAIKTRLQTPHTKVVTLKPSRNTLPFANHTKNVDLEHLKNTQHSLATQLQKYSNQGRKGIEYTWVLQSLKFRITTQSYSTHLRMIQSSFKSWKNCFNYLFLSLQD